MIEVTEDFYFEFIERPEIKRLLHGGGCAHSGGRVMYMLDRQGYKVSKITHDDRFYLADRFEPEIPDRAPAAFRRPVYVEVMSMVLAEGLRREILPWEVTPLKPQFAHARSAGLKTYLCCSSENSFYWEHNMEGPQGIASELIKDPDEFVKIVKEILACKE
jgi:hypothetical protein